MNRTFRDILIITLLGLFFFIPFLGNVHLFDWDEINFAEAAREMIVTGNYTRVQIDFKPFWEKPPLFIWLQVLSMKVFGINEFAARFVNAVFGILTMLTVYLMGRRLYDPLFGMLWALAFLGSFLPHFFFKSGIIDPVFNFFIFGSIWFLYRVTTSQKGSTADYLLAGVSAGLAVLAKGPVGFLIVALTAGVYWLFKRKQHPFTVKQLTLMAMMAGVVALFWFGPETILNGTWFVKEFVRYQLRLLTTGDAGHGRPFYFHFAVILSGCFPASILAIKAFYRHSPADGFNRRDFRFWMLCLFWVVLILFSLVRTKTVLYASMAYFPVTFLAAYHAYHVIKGNLPWNRWQGFWMWLMSIVMGAALALFPAAVYRKELILPYIKDAFAVANLARPVPFSGYEFLMGAGYIPLLAVSLVLIRGQRKAAGFIMLFISSALCLQAYTAVLVPKAEQFTQGGPIAFYREKAAEDCYISPLFKTYAHLFYGQKQPPAGGRAFTGVQLRSGEGDKPAYFVCKSTKRDKWLKKYDLEVIKDEYGYTYFRKLPVEKQRKADSDGR